MVSSPWQLKNPIDAVIFDCDGTLSTIEGIDELAKKNHVDKEVQQLTSEAMGKSGIYPELYQKRLELVKPTLEEVEALGVQYYSHRIPDCSEVIQLLKRLNKSIYIVSAGLYPAVSIFGELLNIPKSNIFAVGIEFDEQGEFSDFDRASPFTFPSGKRIIVSQLKSKHPELAYVGDGLNDLDAMDLVIRFIGFGGAYYRENIASRCEYYIRDSKMAPILPLILTETEIESLTPSEKNLYDMGLEIIRQGK